MLYQNATVSPVAIISKFATKDTKFWRINGLSHFVFVNSELPNLVIKCCAANLQ